MLWKPRTQKRLLGWVVLGLGQELPTFTCTQATRVIPLHTMALQNLALSRHSYRVSEGITSRVRCTVPSASQAFQETNRLQKQHGT